MKTQRRWLAAICIVMAACSATNEPMAATNDAITSVDDTAVREQSIDNCWLYATAAWAEQMHLQTTRQVVDVSEAYWTFWYWYDQIVGGDVSDSYAQVRLPDDGVVSGAFWGTAVELARRYGWMREADFMPTGVSKSEFHTAALKRLNDEVKTGVLSTEAARANKKVVMNELLRVWGVRPQVANNIRQVFGDLGDKTLVGSARAAGFVRPLRELRSRSLNGQELLGFDDVIGTPRAGTDIWEGVREGQWAWTNFNTSKASSARSLLRSIQETLNSDLSVPLSWLVTEDVRGGVYGAIGSGEEIGEHLSILVDYEASMVPGFGTLKLGEPASQAARQAALDVSARVEKLRIKNSWGKEPTWSQTGVPSVPDATVLRTYLPAKPGYNDLLTSYLLKTSSANLSRANLRDANLLGVALPLAQLRHRPDQP